MHLANRNSSRFPLRSNFDLQRELLFPADSYDIQIGLRKILNVQNELHEANGIKH